MVCKDDVGKYYIAGISSFGYGCANETAGFYVDVWYHMDWIKTSDETRNLSATCSGAKRVSQNSIDWREILLIVLTWKYLFYDWIIKQRFVL